MQGGARLRLWPNVDLIVVACKYAKLVRQLINDCFLRLDTLSQLMKLRVAHLDVVL